MSTNINELNTQTIKTSFALSDDQLSSITGGNSKVTLIAPVYFGGPKIQQPPSDPDIKELLDPSKLRIRF